MDRLRAFVDGVLAIVITILVLGIDVPVVDFEAGEQARFLKELWHQLHPYIGSFGLVAAYWVQNVVILHYVAAANRAFVWLNLLFLLPVTLLPFLTELRVDYPREPLVVGLYGGGQILTGLLLLACWRYATAGHRFVAASVDPAVIRSMSVRIALGPLLCLVSALASMINPHLGTIWFITVPLLYVSHRKVDAGWREAPGEE